MNKYCQCLAAGLCDRHGMMKGAELFARCRGTSARPDCGLSYWRAWERGQAGATITPDDPILNPAGFCSEKTIVVVTYLSSVGDKLAEIIKREIGKDIPCSDCERDIEKLNSLTVEECRDVKEKYVENIYKRSFKFADPVQRVELIADKFLKTGIAQATIGRWFDEAVDTGGEPKKASPAPAPNDERERLRELAARVAVAEAERKRNPVHESRVKATDDQNELYRRAMSAPRPEAKPFQTPPLWNLIYHLYPVKGKWEWHAERINDILGLITGKAIIGIVSDGSTSTLADVRQLIPDERVIWIENPNIAESGDLSLRGEPFGEVVTLQQALPMLFDTGDSITIYAHGKGIRDHTRKDNAVRLWAEMMYQTTSLAHKETFAALEKGYDFFCSFRTFGSAPFVPEFRWHPSGTYFNFRTQVAFIDGEMIPVQQVYGGVEAWPGDVVPASRSYCSFEDNSPLLRQYSIDLMYPDVVNRQMQWEVDRIGPVRCEQHKWELDWFLGRITSSDRVLVIGSKHGGLEVQIRAKHPGVQIVSVDIDPQPDNTQTLVIGSSADPQVQGTVRGMGPFSVVFIDGDHSYEGVKADWKFAESLRPRLVAFHDIAVAVKHSREACEVDKLWAEIKRDRYQTHEIIVGCGWGGIGIVDLRKCDT